MSWNKDSNQNTNLTIREQAKLQIIRRGGGRESAPPKCYNYICVHCIWMHMGCSQISPSASITIGLHLSTEHQSQLPMVSAQGGLGRNVFVGQVTDCWCHVAVGEGNRGQDGKGREEALVQCGVVRHRQGSQYLPDCTAKHGDKDAGWSPKLMSAKHSDNNNQVLYSLVTVYKTQIQQLENRQCYRFLCWDGKRVIAAWSEQLWRSWGTPLIRCTWAQVKAQHRDKGLLCTDFGL